MALAFITWLWGDKYNEGDIQKLAAGVRRHYPGDFRFVVYADRPLNLPSPIDARLIANPDLVGRSCFCRLRMFDPTWQGWHGFDDRIISLDLDAVITGSLVGLFDRTEPFLILRGVNAVNPNPFNCSVMMLRAGECAEVWNDFTPEKAKAVPFHNFPDDQGWIWHKLPQAAGWDAGRASGIYGFQKPGWPPGQALPHDARIVAFIGWRKPSMFKHIRWVKNHWSIAV